MSARDTVPRAAAIQVDLYRRATASRRAQVAVELSEATQLTAIDGIRRRHPEYSETQVKRAYLRLVYGEVANR